MKNRRARRGAARAAKEVCLIKYLLDASTSMRGVQQATIRGFNQFKKDQVATPGKVLCSLTRFNRHVGRKDFCDLGALPDLDQENYQLAGGTALLDAIYLGISDVDDKLTTMSIKPKILVVIQTDGWERSSRIHTLENGGIETVANMIRERISLGWGFLYLPATEAAKDMGEKLGLCNQSVPYQQDDRGTGKVMGAVSSVTASFRLGDTEVHAIGTETQRIMAL